MNKRICFFCVGTGGHVLPVRNLIKELKVLGTKTEDIFVICDKRGKQYLDNLNINIHTPEIFVSKKGIVGYIFNIFTISKSIRNISKFLVDKNISVVLTTGAYIAPIAAIVSKILKAKFFIQEQNIYAGLGNKISAIFAKKIYTSFEDTRNIFKSKLKHTGPVVNTTLGRKYIEPLGVQTIGFVGGSQGSEEINKYADEILVPIIMQEVNKKLVINSEPNQASVFLNNVEVGVTPLSVNLNTTSNNILIKKSEYKDSNIDYIVKNNNSDQIIIKLIEDEDVININTVPSQASLFFNEDYIGSSPLKFKIQDRGILKVKKYGYVDDIINITKDTKELNIVLTEDLSEVFISSDPPSDVFLNEEYIGKTPFIKKIQKIKHKISFKSKGFRTLNESFEPTKDKQNIIKKLLTEKEASLLENKKYSRTSIDGEIILFEPGSFLMGSSKIESRRDINEIMRSVKITKHFYISKNLITEEQYSLFKISSKSNLPINNISWIDAAKFCNWLSSKEGFENFYEIKNNQIISFNMDSKGYRLPTEAEWEYVAKSNNPEKYIYSWGSDRKITKLVGNIADVSTQGILSNFIDDYDDGYDERSPVGSFRSNQNEINDLTGNLSEWVNDFYSVEFVQQSKVFQDYIGPLAGTSHVIKGSNYYSSTPLQLGLSYRTYGNEPNDLVGFRIARWIY